MFGRVGVMPGDTRKQYRAELKERAVRMVAEIRDEHKSGLDGDGEGVTGARDAGTGRLHKRWRSAVRDTVFTLADTPKNGDFAHGLAMALAGLPWVLTEREPMSVELDGDLRMRDARRYAVRRPPLTRANPVPRRPPRTLPGSVGVGAATHVEAQRV